MNTRVAIVTAADGVTIERVRQYLPANYDVMLPASWTDADREMATERTPQLLIAGTDNAGWTLDDYVIPRLWSGLIVCRELTAD